MTTIDDKDPPVKNQHSPEARAKAGETRKAKKAAADAATNELERQRFDNLVKATRSIVTLSYDRPSRADVPYSWVRRNCYKVIGALIPGVGTKKRERLTGRYNPPRWKATMVQVLPDLPWHCVSLSGRRQTPDNLNLLGRLKDHS